MSIPNIPGFRILRPLSEGKRSRVYLAEQESLQRLVALKVLSGEVSSDEASRRHVIEDGKAAARLTHPNLLSVFDIGEYAGCYYIATEHVSGGTLRDKLETGPMRAEQALLIARDLAIALAFLHSQGFLHRDIKPTNILFREDGSALLGEAGVSRTASSRSEEVAFGSPHYMSPERAQAMPADSRSDLYSLGVVLWEMLTGKPPFDADDPFAVAIKHITEPVPALPLALANLQSLMARCLAKEPDRRYLGAIELASALDEALGARGVSVSTLPQPALRAPAPVVATAPAPNVAKPQERKPEPQPAPAPVARPAPALDATAVMQPLARPNPVPQAPAADASNATMIAPRAPAPAPAAPVDLGATMVAPRMTAPAPAPAAVPPPAAPPPPRSAPPPPQYAPPPQPAAPPPPIPTQPAAAPQAYDPPRPAPVRPKSSSAAGWLIWIGVIGLLIAATAAWWVIKGSKRVPEMSVPEASEGQLSGSQSAGSASEPQLSVDELLDRAKLREQTKDLIQPENDNAAYYYAAALKLEPNNPNAQLGYEGVATEIERQVLGFISEGKQTSARALVDAALRYYPQRQSLVDKQRELAK